MDVEEQGIVTFLAAATCNSPDIFVRCWPPARLRYEDRNDSGTRCFFGEVW